jgi:hypothetical protein
VAARLSVISVGVGCVGRGACRVCSNEAPIAAKAVSRTPADAVRIGSGKLAVMAIKAMPAISVMPVQRDSTPARNTAHVSDVIELGQGGFSTLQLVLTYAAEAG